MRNETKPFANAEVVRELREVAERAHQQAARLSRAPCLTGRPSK